MNSTKIALSFVFLFTLSCNDKGKDLGTAAPIDKEKIQIGAGKLCPANHTFKLFNEDIAISPDDFPNPALYTISKGSERCANLHNIDHGGVFVWLIVNYNTDCILNGSIWITDSIRATDRDHMYFNLKSIDENDPTKIFIRSNEGYSLNELRKLMGMQVYTCVEEKFVSIY